MLFLSNFTQITQCTWNLAIDQSSRSCTYTILSTPGGRNWAYFGFTGSGFWDTGRFSKFPYLGMKPDHWPKCRKLHIYPLSTPRGRNWAYFRSTGSGFRDMSRFFKIAIFGHETWPSAKVPTVAHILSFYPRWSKLSYFRSMGRGFRDTGRFFNFPIWARNLVICQVQKVAHIPSF